MRDGIMLFAFAFTFNILRIKCEESDLKIPCVCNEDKKMSNKTTMCHFKFHNQTFHYSCFKEARFTVDGSCECVRVSENVDGGWSKFGEWQQWGECELDKIFNKAMRERYRFRYCTEPPPQNEGSYCPELNFDAQNQKCKFDPNKVPVKVDGGWSQYGEWENWGKCKMAVESGFNEGTRIRRRLRTCDNPIPKNEGKYCEGEDNLAEVEKCKLCEANGTWILANYSNWEECSVSCGVGTKKRYIYHICSVPTQRQGVECCTGKAPLYEYENCFRGPCPDEICAKVNGYAPHPQNCSMFTDCKSFELKTCNDNKVFDMDTEQCQIPEPGNCGATCNSLYAPSPEDKQMYLHCVKGRYIRRYCHFYHYWSQSKERCENEDNV